MIVEDHDTARSTLDEWIAAIVPDARIVAFKSGEEAVDHFETDRDMDIALVDIGLPGISGIEVTRKLKKLNPSLKVIALSIHRDKVYAEEALAAGATAYVSKREAPSELKRILHKTIEMENITRNGM